MILHAAHAAKNGHHEILICTVDTDVVVLAETLSPEHEVWLAFGNCRYLVAHRVCTCLGLTKSWGLPLFHALTGCDTVSAFGHGNRSAWSTWNSFPLLTSALIRLAQAPPVVLEESCM